MKICRICPKEATIREFSPIGPDYFFCSTDCQYECQTMNYDFGLVWASMNMEI
jgi:hypothetical protein